MSLRFRVGASLLRVKVSLSSVSRSPSGQAGLLTAAGVAVAVWIGASSYQESQEAARLLRAAEGALNSSLEDAPELQQIPAADALHQVEQAVALGAGGPDVERLRQRIEALVHLQAGDLIFAEGSLRAARLGAGWTPELRVFAAELARRQGDLALAKEHVAAALLDGASPRARLLRADLALDEGDAVLAEETLRGLLQDHDAVASLHNRRALALEDLGRYAEAELELERATAIDPDLADPWINLGRLQLDRGAPNDAVAAFDRAIQLQRGSSDAHLGRGLARVAAAQLAGETPDPRADADFRRAAELAPHTAVPLLALGDLQRSRGRIAEALTSYRDAIARDPSPAAGWVKLGNALMLSEETHSAARAYREALERDGTLAAAYNGLGAALLALGRLSDAEAALERAAALDPADPHPWRNLARLREASGDAPGAQAALLEAEDRRTPFI